MQKFQGDEALGQQLSSQMILEKSYFILYFQLLGKFGLFQTFKRLHFMQCDLKKKKKQNKQYVMELSPHLAHRREAACFSLAAKLAKARPQSIKSHHGKSPPSVPPHWAFLPRVDPS